MTALGPSRFVTRYELRRCNSCEHENVRPARTDARAGEVPCPCGGHEFTIFDLVAVPRGHTVLQGSRE